MLSYIVEITKKNKYSVKVEVDESEDTAYNVISRAFEVPRHWGDPIDTEYEVNARRVKR